MRPPATWIDRAITSSALDHTSGARILLGRASTARSVSPPGVAKPPGRQVRRQPFAAGTSDYQHEYLILGMSPNAVGGGRGRTSSGPVSPTGSTNFYQSALRRRARGTRYRFLGSKRSGRHRPVEGDSRASPRSSPPPVVRDDEPPAAIRHGPARCPTAKPSARTPSLVVADALQNARFARAYRKARLHAVAVEVTPTRPAASWAPRGRRCSRGRIALAILTNRAGAIELILASCSRSPSRSRPTAGAAPRSASGMAAVRREPEMRDRTIAAVHRDDGLSWPRWRRDFCSQGPRCDAVDPTRRGMASGLARRAGAANRPTASYPSSAACRPGDPAARQRARCRSQRHVLCRAAMTTRSAMPRGNTSSE